MIPTQTIEDKANTKIAAGSLSDIEYAQLTSISASFTGAANKVATFSALPAAATKKGIIYYVISERIYYFSDGASWRSNFTSSFGNDAVAGIASAWGYNGGGRVGDNTTTTSRLSPVLVVGGLNPWSQVSGGTRHSLGISGGIAYAWGYGSYGRLGDGTTTAKSSPVTVVGGLTWSQVSAGAGHSLGVTTSGVAYGWGVNFGGGVGDNTTTSRLSPVTVVGGLTWSQVSASGQGTQGSSLGITSAGVAYGWGYATYGRLGDNTSTNKSSPVSVVGGITTWSQVSAGASFGLGITSAGVAYGWGSNDKGQLGANDTTMRSSPVVIVGSLNWSQVSGGSGGGANRGNSIGIAASVAYAWGQNDYGQLGDGTTVSKSSPVTVVGGITNWSQVSAGEKYVIGLRSSGIAYAWGMGYRGRLGDGTIVSRSSPVTVVGGITTWTQVSAGFNHSLGISSLGLKGFI